MALTVATVLVGCGGGDSTTVIERTVVEREDINDPLEPRGPLAAHRIGPVSQDMTLDEVRGLFGDPDQTKRLPGCELDASASQIVVWEWLIGDGKLQLSFDGASDRLVSYRTDSETLATTSGNRVGGRFAEVRQAWADELKPFSLGAASTSQNGYWYVGDPATAELLFDIRNGRTVSISGGYLPPCE